MTRIEVNSVQINQNTDLNRPGDGFFIILRLYGTRREYYDGTWKPSNLEKIGS